MVEKCPHFRKNAWSMQPDVVPEPEPIAAAREPDFTGESFFAEVKRPRPTMKLPDLIDPKVRKNLNMTPIDTEELFKNLPKSR